MEVGMMKHHRGFISGVLVALTLSVASAQPVPLAVQDKALQESVLPSGDAIPLADPSMVPGQELAEQSGRLAIQVIQGTPGGPEIGITDVEVDLLHQSKVIKTIKSQLDKYGVVVLDDLPIKLGVQPVVRIKYAGVTYQEVGAIMDPANPQQMIQVICHEVTNDAPAWKIPIRQIMINYAPEGLKVTEIMVVDNPARQTWLGTPQPSGEPVTTVLPLPVNAEQVELGKGFHGWCCTEFENGKVKNHLPLMPHITELDFSYVVSAQDGSVVFDIQASADIEKLIVIVPDQMETVSTEGLELGGSRSIADTQVRFYTAEGFAKGAKAVLTLSGLSREVIDVADETSKAQGSGKTMAIIGGGLLVVIVFFVVFAKSGTVSKN